MAKKSASKRGGNDTWRGLPPKASRRARGPKGLAPQPGELIVRMYRQGLGDCFLLAFGASQQDSPRFVLIDCGVHMRQTDGPQRLLQVLKDLKSVTNGRLDVVVATHEHADHLSGFVQKNSPFLAGDIKIGDLWVAWTERRGDQQADALRKKRGSARQVIEKAVQKALEQAQNAVARQLELLTDFERPPDGAVDAEEVGKTIRALAKDSPEHQSLLRSLDGRSGAAGDAGVSGKQRKGPSANELALGLLAVRAEQTTYCQPGMTPPLTIPDVPDVRVYVLGPPRDETLLKKDLPTKIRGSSSEDGHGKYKEVYLSGGANTRAFQLSPALGAADQLGESNQLHDDLRYPFAKTFYRNLSRVPSKLEDLKKAKDLDSVQRFYAERYFELSLDGQAQSKPADMSWRRIDGDWLGAAERLALNLDSDTNNTSLVLAFECGPVGSGRVLLFPGDAQVGNWLSWRDQEYRSGRTSVSADDLMSRTILYKVGHHASHNATVKCDPREPSPDHDHGVPFGLELMDNIVALIPVDRDAAEKNMPTPWEMPHRPLYERLREKAQRRVLRADLKLTPLNKEEHEPDLVPRSTEWTDVPGLKGAKWRRSKEEFAAGTAGPLYYDIFFPLGGG